MATKRIGLLFGMEDTFPWALIQAIDAIGGGEVVGVPVDVAFLADRESYDYALILDRISHEVPFYRTFLKAAAARGTQVINNPFWWSADDKYFGVVVAELAGVAAPRTALIPHKHRPPNTEATSFRNLRLVDWDAVFDEPMVMRPCSGAMPSTTSRVKSLSSLYTLETSPPPPHDTSFATVAAFPS